MLHALEYLVVPLYIARMLRSMIHATTSYLHLSDNLESTTSSEDNGSGQASDLLVVLGVDVGEDSVLAL
jgi:hypothetical protein